MMWRRVALGVSVFLAVVVCVMAVRSSNLQSVFFDKPVNVKVLGSGELPILPYPITGLALSGSWEGTGRAQVVLVTDKGSFLVFDSNSLSRAVDLSFEYTFEKVCVQSCSLPLATPLALQAIISGPGYLTISQYHYTRPLTLTGLAFCPTCQSFGVSNVPNHSLVIAVILLVLCIGGAHVVMKHCKRKLPGKIALIVFVTSVLVMGGVFGAAMASSESGIAVSHIATVIAGLGIIAVMVLFSIEMRSPAIEEEQVQSRVWKDLEAEEEKWERK